MMKDNVPTSKAGRRFERRVFDRAVGLSYRGRVGFESVREISEGGMLIQVDAKYKVGDRIEIGLHVPNGNLQTVIGAVVYMLEDTDGERCIGIRFMQPSAILREQIRRYVAGK